MSAPLTPDQFVAALRAEGLTVIEHPGWRTHNRNGHGAWGPVNGIMLHHTVTGPKVNGAQLCYDGYAELPGPLCHGVVRRDGVVVMVGNGRANHAGGGSPTVLQAVIDEDYGDWPPETHHHQGSAGAVDGNSRFYGFECENDGKGEPWPAAQVESMVRLSSALSRAHKWSAKSTIAHAEWSDWKNDPKGPGMPSMPEMRRRIAERLSHAANWTKPKTPTTPAPKPPAPTAPATVSGMEFLMLTRSEDLVLMPGQEAAIYWTVENYDQGQNHGDGGKTVAIGPAQYTGTLYLNSSATIRAYAGEEDSNSVVVGRADTVQIQPTGDSISVTGKVGQRLVFLVKNDGPTQATVYFARLNLQLSPLS